MKIGPDGSLCRITSSAKDLINNIRIVKEPDSEPSYKLVVIRSHDECEELSEKSDDENEMSDDELCDIKFPSKSIEKEKVIDAKIDKHNKSNETVREGTVRERKSYNRDRHWSRERGTYHKRNNKFYNQRNNFKNDSRKYKRQENSYKYRNFNHPVNPSVAYNTPIQRASDDYSPSPWIDPPVMRSNYTCSSFSLATPLPNKPRNSCGLLGDRPSSYPPPLPQFQSNKQNDIREQSSTYPPVASNFPTNTTSDDFVREQNLSYSPINSNFQSNTSSDKNLPYPSMSHFSASNHNSSFIHSQNSYSQRKNYQSSKRTDSFHDQSYWNESYSKYNNNNNQQGNEQLNNKNQRKQNTWNKKQRRQRPNFTGDNYKKNF